MKKILVIQGGGRPRGNTAQLVDSFVRGAEDAGNCVEVISLNKHEVKGCLGCNACRYGKPCVQKDSFNEIVPKIKGADFNRIFLISAKRWIRVFLGYAVEAFYICFQL